VDFHPFDLRRLARPLTLALAGIALAIPVAPASAGSGGTSADGSGGGGSGCTARRDAQLDNGKATIPCDAPGRVANVIQAANRIAKGHPYCYGGGHGSFRDNCYDCSGAVSYALHGGRFVSSPMPSGSYMSWGRKGKGNWITVFANNGHVYAKIAGLRWDTSMTAGAGPGWSKQNRSSSGFRVRHPGRY
jgi:hypothetical protein